MKHPERWLLGGLFAVLVCCFTPLLVIIFGVLGLAWFVGYTDYVLTPLLGFLLSLLTLTLYKKYQKKMLLYPGAGLVLFFATLYFVWSLWLGLLLLGGSVVAFFYYQQKIKNGGKICKK